MKDPAFLFYSKDWIEGTAELLPNEKGVYIDLLCYQHQRGDLPNDTKRLARMVGMSVDEFEQIWKTLSSKFEANGERTLNRKLSEVMGARKEKGKTNKIIGIFGSLCRSASETKENLNTIRSQFKVSDFTEIPESEVSERLSEWFNNRLASLGNANANANKDGNGKGTGKPRKEKEPKIPTIGQVIDYFAENGYPESLAKYVFGYYEKIRDGKGSVWKDTNGNTVKDWKAKMRVVWFKDENKTKFEPKTTEQSSQRVPL